MSLRGKILLNRVTRRFTVGELVQLLLLVMVLITAVNVGAVYVTLSQFDTLDNSVDVAGEQRMLTQRMTRFTNHLATGHTSPDTYVQLENAADRYEKNLQTLQNGGQVDGNSLDPAPAEIDPHLETQRSEWDEFRSHIDIVLATDPGEPKFETSVTYIQAHSDDLLETSDRTVKAFTEYIDSQFQLLQLLLIVLFGSTIGLFVVGGYLSHRYVGNILADVTEAIESKAEGSLATELDPSTKELATVYDDSTRNEVVKLAQTTQEFETNLNLVVQQTRALAQQDFDDSALEEDVPGEFGTSLDDMQTRLKELISELRASERRLEKQRDSLKVLNQTVRHDIRNDLQLVLAYAETLAERVDGEKKTYVQTIQESAKEAVDITDTARDVTDVMLKAEAEREPVDLQSVLLEEIESIKSNNERTIVEIDGEIPEVAVYADTLLDAVFRNILKNAVLHNDKEVAKITVSGRIENGRVTIRIADNGPGIAEDVKDEIFGKGEKGLKSGGTGLGLYLVKTLIDRYRGNVSVGENQMGGSVFTVELQVVES